jgi:hypothetical protein
MVEFIIREYGPALQAGISRFGENETFRVQTHYHDAYFKTVLSDGNAMLDENHIKSWRKRVVDDEGNVQSAKARYDELVDICVELFNQQCIAVLRGIQCQAKRIYTVDVVGYENRTLKVLLNIDGEFQP